MVICKYENWIFKILLIVTVFFFIQIHTFAGTFEDLKKSKKTSYLDFILLKIENRLVMRHSLLGSQPVALRVQYQNVGSQVDFSEEKNKIIISIIGVMDKRRYSNKKYKPKMSDCNILRNILLYGKYGYNFIFQKRNAFLTNAHMEEIFISTFLSNLSISKEEKDFIIQNTNVIATVIDPVRGNNITCAGNVARDLE